MAGYGRFANGRFGVGRTRFRPSQPPLLGMSVPGSAAAETSFVHRPPMPGIRRSWEL